LDKSQASGKHEKALLDADKSHDLGAFNTHVVIGQSPPIRSATPRVSWRRQGRLRRLDELVGIGRGRGGPFRQDRRPGFKAQNNTQSIITDPDTISRFSAELIAEHLTAQKQSAATTKSR